MISACHGLRLTEALDSLEHNPGGDGEESEAVGKRDQHLEAVEAIGSLPVGGPAREAKAEPRQ